MKHRKPLCTGRPMEREKRNQREPLPCSPHIFYLCCLKYLMKSTTNNSSTLSSSHPVVFDYLVQAKQAARKAKSENVALTIQKNSDESNRISKTTNDELTKIEV